MVVLCAVCREKEMNQAVVTAVLMASCVIHSVRTVTRRILATTAVYYNSNSIQSS